MNVQEKIERAKQAVQFVATHDDESVRDVSAALREIEEYTHSELKRVKIRREGGFFTRISRYFGRLGRAFLGKD